MLLTSVLGRHSFLLAATGSIEAKLALLWSMVSELSSIIMRGNFFIRDTSKKVFMSVTISSAQWVSREVILEFNVMIIIMYTKTNYNVSKYGCLKNVYFLQDIKGGLISESFFLWLKSANKDAKAFPLALTCINDMCIESKIVSGGATFLVKPKSQTCGPYFLSTHSI